jgi:hypothetical protein
VAASPFAAGELLKGLPVSEGESADLLTSGDAAGLGQADAGFVVVGPAGLNLAVAGTGVRMPILQLAGIQPASNALRDAITSIEEAQDVPGPAVLASPAPPIQSAPAGLRRAAEIAPYKPPVFPRKQARH